MAKRGKPLGGKRIGGRAKGTPNKRTLFLLQALEDCDWDLIKDLHDAFKELSPQERVDASIRLMEFVYPKRQAVDMTVTANINTFSEAVSEIDKFITVEGAEVHEQIEGEVNADDGSSTH